MEPDQFATEQAQPIYMASSPNATIHAPKEMAAVTGAYERLCVEVDELAKRAAMLEERISWVLTPEGPEEEGQAEHAWPQTGVELADRISGVQRNVQAISRRLADVHARVEL